MSGGVYSHPESVELLVSPTEDMGKILGALHGIPVRGKGVEAVEGRSGVDIAASVQVASLALKHRKNKNGQQRIVVFVGSPLSAVETRALVKAGRGLKKNNVAIDVVAMGELEENEDKLKQMVDAANGSNDTERTCHLVTIPPGILPSDVLVGSPIINGGDASGGGGGGGFPSGSAGESGGGGVADEFAEFGGVNPNMDPELAMALRVSMEEERARQERIAREQAAAANTNEDGAAAGGEAKEGEEQKTEMEVEETKEDTSGPSAAAMNASIPIADDLGDEDALLQQALEMSMAETQAATATTRTGGDSSKLSDTPMDDDEEDENAAMQMALQMSMQVDEGSDGSGQPPQQFQDPRFVNQLLGSLPGVNPNDPAIRNALENFQSSKDDDGDKKDSSDKKEDEKE